MKNKMNRPSELPSGSEVAYSIGRMLILLMENELPAKQLAELEGVNPRTYQRYIQGLQAAGLEIEREGKNKAIKQFYKIATQVETVEIKSTPNDYLKIGEIVRVLHNRGGLTAKQLSDLLIIDLDKTRLMLKQLVLSGCLYSVLKKNENHYYHLIQKSDDIAYTRCPQCGAKDFWKDGMDTRSGRQRFKCKTCGKKWNGQQIKE